MNLAQEGNKNNNSPAQLAEQKQCCCNNKNKQWHGKNKNKNAGNNNTIWFGRKKQSTHETKTKTKTNDLAQQIEKEKKTKENEQNQPVQHDTQHCQGQHGWYSCPRQALPKENVTHFTHTGRKFLHQLILIKKWGPDNIFLLENALTAKLTWPEFFPLWLFLL